MLQDKSKKPSSKAQSTKVEKLQTLTIAELNAIAGGGVNWNHNEAMVKFPNLATKQKPSSKVRKLQTLTIAELNAITGGGVDWNHNQTIVSLA